MVLPRKHILNIPYKVTESVTKNTYMTKKGRVTEYRDENGELHHDTRAALINPEGFHFYNLGVKYKKIDPKGTVFWYNKKGQRHRMDGPAVEMANGDKEWYQNGLRHREDGPAIEEKSGVRMWFQHGKRHRLDGPAMEFANGDKVWYQHDKLHREDGPAREWEDGTKAWYQNGQRHRLDGPAIERIDGTKEYWIKGQRYTEKQFKEKTQNLTESVTKNVRITKKGRIIEYRDENGELHHDTRAALINPDGFHFYNHGVKYKKIDPKGNIYWYDENGNYHRDDGPAVEEITGHKAWYQHGDVSAVEEITGYKAWYQHGKLHRLDGPAREYADGTKEWYQHNKLHREDGPAIERTNGTKVWCQNDKCHRLDGPAVEWANGKKEYYINDIRYPEKQFKAKTKNLTESVTKNIRITKKGRVIEYRDENGKLHHDTRAALIDPEGFHFYNHGVLYKKIDPKGNVFWYDKYGHYHREDGPAIELANGTKEWHQHGELHREDGPAVEYADGYKAWYQNGIRHREDGPAVEYADGYKEYWINGTPFTKQEFKEKIKNIRTTRNK